MNYLKSALVGFVTVVVICGIFPIIATLIQIIVLFLRHADGGFGIDFGPLRWHAPSITHWFVVFATFAIGFLWELRRLAKRRVAPSAKATNLPV